MKWIDRNCKVPEPHELILVFSPAYPEKSDMRFIITEGQFLKYMRDATHWIPLREPDQKWKS